MFVENEAGLFRVTFHDVPEFFSTEGNSFSVTLSPNGDVEFDYGDIAAIDGLVGITEGGGVADPGATDFYWFTGQCTSDTTYELFGFGAEFDLDNWSLQFVGDY